MWFALEWCKRWGICSKWGSLARKSQRISKLRVEYRCLDGFSSNSFSYFWIFYISYWNWTEGVRCQSFLFLHRSPMLFYFRLLRTSPTVWTRAMLFRNTSWSFCWFFFFLFMPSAVGYHEDWRVIQQLVYFQRKAGQLRPRFHLQVTAPFRVFLPWGRALSRPLTLLMGCRLIRHFNHPGSGFTFELPPDFYVFNSFSGATCTPISPCLDPLKMKMSTWNGEFIKTCLKPSWERTLESCPAKKNLFRLTWKSSAAEITVCSKALTLALNDHWSHNHELSYQTFDLTIKTAVNLIKNCT